jgi:hypothetical protein
VGYLSRYSSKYQIWYTLLRIQGKVFRKLQQKLLSASVTALKATVENYEGPPLIDGPECKCPNDCEDTVYYHEMSFAKTYSDSFFYKLMARKGGPLYELTKIINDATDVAEIKKADKKLVALTDDLCLVHVYFKELGIVKYQRDELYGIMDVIGTTTICCYFQVHSISTFFSCMWWNCWLMYGF